METGPFSPGVQLILIIAVGAASQLIAWRLKLPSILFLLIAGVLCGPVAGVLTPHEIFGPSLEPLVQLAVALILFEGGLSLKPRDRSSAGSVALSLITVGALLNLVCLTALAYVFLPLSLPLAALLAAILVVTGPTVVIPLLRTLRIRSPVRPILHWEGILIDPIGVLLAILIAEICAGQAQSIAPIHMLLGIGISLTAGVVLGLLAAKLVTRLIGAHILPDYLHIPFTIAVIFVTVLLSDTIHHESGLVAVTVMGMSLARCREAWIHSIEEFVGHLQSIFIAILFVVLSAGLKPEYLSFVNLGFPVFLLGMIFIARPLSVMIATVRSDLSLKHRLAISSIAPRGIVSASLASSLGLSLARNGVEGAEALTPYAFLSIIFTVIVYSFGGRWACRKLGVSEAAREGALFVGGTPFARHFASSLRNHGFQVAVVDTNYENIRLMEREELTCYSGSILSEGLKDRLNLEGIGKLLALTANDEANSLAVLEFRSEFGAAWVYQFAGASQADERAESRLEGRVLCDAEFSWPRVEELWRKGYRIDVLPAAEVLSRTSSENDHERAVVLGTIESSGALRLRVAGEDKSISEEARVLVFAPPHGRWYITPPAAPSKGIAKVLEKAGGA